MNPTSSSATQDTDSRRQMLRIRAALVRRFLERGSSVNEIARQLGCSRPFVQRVAEKITEL